MKDNPYWSKIEELLPRQINGVTYTQLKSQLSTNEALLVKIEVTIMRKLFPVKNEVACWLSNINEYAQLRQRLKPVAGEIKGYYAVDKDRLLSLLFSWKL
jgi:hypothetical protein